MRNRFKGLDLIDRVPGELWNEVRDIVQETGIKTIPMEKKCKKAKWLSVKALQIAVKKTIIQSCNPTPGHISGENHSSRRYLHPYVCGSTIYDNQDMETT